MVGGREGDYGDRERGNQGGEGGEGGRRGRVAWKAKGAGGWAGWEVAPVRHLAHPHVLQLWYRLLQHTITRTRVGLEEQIRRDPTP